MQHSKSVDLFEFQILVKPNQKQKSKMSARNEVVCHPPGAIIPRFKEILGLVQL
jgi:hypothetical protein